MRSRSPVSPGSAWNQAIRSIHETIRKRGGGGIIGQLDFSATPKNDKGVIFPHVVCDTPLGEAVDAGIIKTPVIGKSRQIIVQPHDNAAYRFEAHLRLGMFATGSARAWRGSWRPARIVSPTRRLQTARTLGLEVPNSLQLLADEVIE